MSFGNQLNEDEAKSFAGSHPRAVLQDVVASAKTSPLTAGPAGLWDAFHVLTTSMGKRGPLQHPSGVGSAITGKVSTGDSDGSGE